MPAPISVEAIIQLLSEEQIVDCDEPLKPESNLLALGMDSLALMQFLLRSEQVFGVTLRPEFLRREHLTSPAALAVLLSNQASVL